MKTYRNDKVAVEWRPELCVHCQACIQGLPSVFDLNKRPWVNVDGAEPKAITDQVSNCPSGALTIATNEQK